MADSKKGLTLADLVNMVGQNRIAINFVWTLVTGYLVMFMQAGFALVETGLCRAKNANHTMMMNFMVYGFGLFAYWVMGFAIQQGGCGAESPTWAGSARSTREFAVNFLVGKPWGLFGTKGFFLTRRDLRRRRHGDVPVPDGVHGHRRDDRHRRRGGTLEVCRLRDLGFVPGRDHVSALRQLGMGRRLALAARRQLSSSATATATSPAREWCTRSAA